MITISHVQLQGAISKALDNEIQKVIANRFTVGNDIETLVRQAVVSNRAAISDAIDRELKSALASNEFMATVRSAILKAFSEDLVRAFDGVASGAGRKAAQEIGAQKFVEAIAAPRAGSDPV